MDNPYLHPKIKELSPIFEEWLAMNKKCKDVKDDDVCLYWDTEPHSVSSLAAAVWKRNGIALVEFTQPKKKVRNGRGDLWFSLDKNVGTDFYVEAKQCYIKLPNVKLAGCIEKSLNEATEDARNLKIPNDNCTTKLGLTFIVPYIESNQNINRLVSDFDNAILEVTPKPDLIVTFHNQGMKYKKYYYPCVALLGRIVV